MSLTDGKILNERYRIDKQIGQGGFGSVYRAFDLTLAQPCAIKENLNPQPETQRQFEREALLLARLRHPNLPRVIDHFSLPDSGQYLVMDFVEGYSLYHMLKLQQDPISEAEALAWIDQVCQALAYLHRQNPPIIHRDIKPQNIIVTPDGQAMLVDFGPSKLYDEQLKTTTGARGVTYGYAPPEQYGQGRTTTRSDVYALGATLYTMLTRQRPPDAIDRLVSEVTLVPPRQLSPHLSPHIEQAILKAMELTTSKRFDSVETFRQALSHPPAPAVVQLPDYSLDPAVPNSETQEEPSPRGQRFGLLWLGLAALAAIILGGLTALGLTWIYPGGVEPAAANVPTATLTNIAFIEYQILPTRTPAPTSTGLPATYTLVLPVDRLISSPILTHTSTPPPAAATPEPLLTSPPPPSPTILRPEAELRELGSIAFISTRDGSEAFYMMKADGTESTFFAPVIRPTNWSRINSAWSPDGQHLAFMTGGDGTSFSLHIVDRHNANEIVVPFKREFVSLETIIWSPDGQRLAFRSATETYTGVYVVNRDGANLTLLVPRRGPGAVSPPAWSPDGQRIAIMSERDGQVGIYIMNADGTNQTLLADQSGFPAWSPDGQYIAVDGNSGGEILVMNADGSNLTKLAFKGDYNYELARWSPDGQRIAYQSWVDGATGLNIINSDGSNLINLSPNGGSPSWSPDGQHLVFIENGAVNSELYVVKSDGSNLVKIAQAGQNPVWSPDGAWLAFESGYEQDAEIYVARADGSAVIALTQNQVSDLQPVWLPN